MTKKLTFYHGDLDFFQVDKLPKKYTLIGKMKTHSPQNSPVTGHAHTITSDTAFEVYKADDFAYVFPGAAAISHEEHRTEDFAPGTYILEREQEENPRTVYYEHLANRRIRKTTTKPNEGYAVTNQLYFIKAGDLYEDDKYFLKYTNPSTGEEHISFVTNFVKDCGRNADKVMARKHNCKTTKEFMTAGGA